MPKPSDKVVNVYCPHCQAGHPVREHVLGRLAKCTACGQRFVLRADAPAAELPPPQSSAPHAEQRAEQRANPLATPVTSGVSTAASTPSQPPPFEPHSPEASQATPAAPNQSSTPATLRADPPRGSSVPPIFVGPLPPPPATGESPPQGPPPPAVAHPPRRGRSTAAAAHPAGSRQLPWPLRFLRLAATSLEVLAAVSLCLTMLSTLVLLVRLAASGGGTSVAAALLAAGGLLAWSVAGVVMLFLLAQWIRLALLIEENTHQTLVASRATAAACEALARQDRAASLPHGTTAIEIAPPTRATSPSNGAGSHADEPTPELGLEATQQSP